MGFADDVAASIEKTIRKGRNVLRTAAQKVAEDAQRPRDKKGGGGRMRVDTGFLRNSFQSSLNGSTSLTGPESYTLVHGAQLGDTITMGWTASYAAAREFGARGQAPDFFMRGALQKWPQFVKEAEREYS